jgi:hypothetical protein
MFAWQRQNRTCAGSKKQKRGCEEGEKSLEVKSEGGERRRFMKMFFRLIWKFIFGVWL